MKKNAKRGTSGDLAKQNEFEIEIKKLFWAGNSNLKNMINKGKKRSLKDKIENLKFLEGWKVKESLLLVQRILSIEKRYSILLINYLSSGSTSVNLFSFPLILKLKIKTTIFL